MSEIRSRVEYFCGEEQTDLYQEDLAYVHDVGHTDLARQAGPGLLDIFARRGIRDGLVVDLGCGSGVWAAQLLERGYQILGVDISQAMIHLTRKRAPAADLRVGSLFDLDIPPCRAVTSLGECIGYLFDEGDVQKLFERVRAALTPGVGFLAST